MSDQRLLSKSRFQLAKECPTKLFYTGKKEYPDQKSEDNFLQTLADGGFQVGALAKLYFPEGVKNDIDELGYEKSVEQTDKLLEQKNVVIFEAAIRFKNLFIRVDILVKKGNKVQLIEVKAKSFSGDDETDLLNKSGESVNGDLRSYLEDVAFQKYVISNAHPEFNVTAYLMLANKKAIASVDGLNQLFKIRKEGDRKRVEVDAEKLKKISLGEKILVQLNAEKAIEILYEEKDENGRDFIEQIKYFASQYESDKKIVTPVSVHCKGCEFRATNEEEVTGKKNGFKECWRNELKLSDDDFKKPFVFEIWNYRAAKKRIEEKRFFIEELNESDFKIEQKEKGLSSGDRQWIQVEKSLKNDSSPYIDFDGLKTEMKQWKFPLHFIDFETTAVAIPFFKGMRPYEGVAFQYSHHTVSENGTIEHSGQYLNTTIGAFPNFDFVRNLKKELENDKGSIFRYATHENTYLNMIYNQLDKSDEYDKNELREWIKTITQSTKSAAEEWEGERNMIDLCDMVKKYFYHPLTKGSNSIKKILPAILNESKHLQAKYSKPVYGSGIKSLNFKDKIWIEMESGSKSVKDPYKLLPPIFEDHNLNDEINNFISQNDMEELADGGAAMTAYNLIQFTDGFLSVNEALQSALLKYCELDTLAMVMIWEYWDHLITNKKN